MSTSSRIGFLSAILVLGAAFANAQADEPPFGNRSNLWRSEDFALAFRHMGEIYSSRPVKRGANVSELPRGETIETFIYRHDGDDVPIEDYFRRARTTGFIVLQDGKIVFERYLAGADERSLLTSWSMAKSFTATLVGLALGDGLITSLDDPIDKYVPELKASGFAGVPIKAVLQMSSGVEFEEEYESSTSDIFVLWESTIVNNTQPGTDFLIKAESGRPAFEAFSYSSLDTLALGWLVSKVTGKSLSDYLSEKLWVPLGMESDASWNLDGKGVSAKELAFCCLNATLRDYARFGELMLNDGAWNGQQLLPKGWVASATRPDRPQVMPGKLHPGWSFGYQYQWWVFPDDGSVGDGLTGFTAQGVHGQFLYVNPRKRMVIVATNAWEDFWDYDLEIEIYDIFHGFAEQ